MKSVAQLLSTLGAADEAARIGAAKAPGNLRTRPARDRAVPALFALLRESPDAGERWAAAYALTWIGDDRARAAA